VHHCLFVPTEDVAKVLAVLMQCLAQATHVAVTEDSEAATEEGARLSVSFSLLRDQEPDQGLGGGELLARLPCHFRSSQGHQLTGVQST
jgi:hypothetical protein